jgi:hypothetical protein
MGVVLVLVLVVFRAFSYSIITEGDKEEAHLEDLACHL